MNALQPQELIGVDVIDPAGEKIGKVGTVYLANATQVPEWVTVKTGLFGQKENFVPLSGANRSAEGLLVRVSKEKVKDAPQIDADGHLSEDETSTLYRYYGAQRTAPVANGQHERQDDMAGTGNHRETDHRKDMPGNGAAGNGMADKGMADKGMADNGAAGRGAAGRQTEHETMIRSEERMKVGTETAESGRATLRKYVVTEEQTVTVPVSHEEVRVEREPISPAEAKRLSGTEIAEQQAEVVLHEERPVVHKESVPVEKVRLATEQVTEDATVTDKVRKEQFEMTDPKQSATR